MKSRAKTSRDKPATIYAEALQSLPDEARARIPAADVVKRTLRNQKILRHPPVPDTLDGLVVDGEWATTGGQTPQPFLFYDNGSDGCHPASRILAFGSTECLKLLGSATKWFIDGNFSMAPRNFLQVRAVNFKYVNYIVTSNLAHK